MISKMAFENGKCVKIYNDDIIRSKFFLIVYKLFLKDIGVV